jgi:hypothetical protein
VVLVACGGKTGPERSPSSPGPATSSPSSVVSTSPAGDGPTVAAEIALHGREALGLAVVGGSVWAVAYRGSTLDRVDPTTDRVTATTRLGGNSATLLAAGDDLWAAGYGGPGAGSTISRMFAGGDLWVSSDFQPLQRIDPATGKVIERVGTRGGVPFFADGGLVWGAAPSEIWAVNAHTGAVVRRIQLSSSIEVISLGIGLGALWAGIRHPGYVGAVQRIDLASGDVTDELSDVDIPAHIEIGFGSVWVTDSGGAGHLFRIDPGPG